MIHGHLGVMGPAWWGGAQDDCRGFTREKGADEQMPDSRVFPPLDPENLVRLGEVNAMAACPARFEPGVRKF